MHVLVVVGWCMFAGPGSNNDEITAGTRSVLARVLSALGIRSMLDIGCGDLNWMQHFNLSGQRLVRRRVGCGVWGMGCGVWGVG